MPTLTSRFGPAVLAAAAGVLALANVQGIKFLSKDTHHHLSETEATIQDIVKQTNRVLKKLSHAGRTDHEQVQQLTELHSGIAGIQAEDRKAFIGLTSELETIRERMLKLVDTVNSNAEQYEQNSKIVLARLSEVNQLSREQLATMQSLSLRNAEENERVEVTLSDVIAGHDEKFTRITKNITSAGDEQDKSLGRLAVQISDLNRKLNGIAAIRMPSYYFDPESDQWKHDPTGGAPLNLDGGNAFAGTLDKELGGL